MDGVILLEVFNKFEESMGGLQVSSDDYNDEMKSTEVELEELHHCIDIKEDFSILEYQEDNHEKTPSNLNTFFQIKTEEETEANLEDLHPLNDIKEETSMNESELDQDCDIRVKLRFQCKICKKSFTKQNQVYHSRTHTGEKPFKCNICDYKCSTKHNLKCHVRTHTGDKPFKCNICDYKSTRRGRLSDHLLTHTDERPYECTVCDYKSFTKQTLRYHLLSCKMRLLKLILAPTPTRRRQGKIAMNHHVV